MIFKIDENLPREACTLFRQAGHDAVAVGEQQLSGTSDNELYAACQQKGRALVTLDVDFANLRAYPPGRSAGVIVLRLKQQGRPSVLSTVRTVLLILKREAINGRLWIVEEQRIRIRT